MPDNKTMQQEAIQRAIEMQNRSRQKPSPPSPPLPSPQTAEIESSNNEEKPGFFEILFQDTEKTLILLLILLLSSEECDIALIFALLYLVL